MSSGRTVIRDLDVMESIVAKNRNLVWEGWNVVSYNKKHTSFMNPRGRFWKGAWHEHTVYPVTEDGWSIPRGLMK